MRKIGLFFGSFNPVHVGHMIIANFMWEHTPLDEVWLVVSPHNPLKKKSTLAPDFDRLHLVQLAIGNNPGLRASNIEFDLPQPSYTIDTLAHLREKYPDRSFCLIMGGDNLKTLHKWKNYELILRDYQIFAYRRPGYEPGKIAEHPSVFLFDAPLMHISSSYIRSIFKKGFSARYLLPEPVRQEIQKSGLYRL